MDVGDDAALAFFAAAVICVAFSGVFSLGRWPHDTGRPQASRFTNTPRLPNTPRTMSCLCVDVEQQMVVRTRRVIRVRHGRGVRAIFCVERVRVGCVSASRGRVEAPQRSVEACVRPPGSSSAWRVMQPSALRRPKTDATTFPL